MSMFIRTPNWMIKVWTSMLTHTRNTPERKFNHIEY